MIGEKKRLYIMRLIRQRDELAGRITRIDEEIEASWNGKAAIRRGRPRTYTSQDEERVFKLSAEGLGERKIAKVVGIPHATVGRMLKHKARVR